MEPQTSTSTRPCVAALAAFALSHSGLLLVVHCFEDVHARQVCNRRWFDEWFEERHGIEVPELTDASGRIAD